MSELSLQGFLDECEREKLHHIQAIQPGGVLLGGVEGDPRVTFVSANALDWLIQSPDEILDQPLTNLFPNFPPPPMETILIPFESSIQSTVLDDRDWMYSFAGKRLYRNLYTGPQGLLDGILSCNENNWLLELEPALPVTLHNHAYRPVSHHLYRIPNTDEQWRQHCQCLTNEMRTATGFERVMLYYFRDERCGEVISESLAEGLTPYLGLRYPASDIPQIARTLYLANRHRQISDVKSTQVRIFAARESVVDLSLSDLRAVSPVHIQYLANMGVTASLSFSLVLFGRLWGLVACHHSKPRALALPLRERCAEMAQVFTLAIAGYRNSCRLNEITESDRAITQLFEAIQQTELSEIFPNNLNLNNSEQNARSQVPAMGRAFLSLVAAEGAALVDAEKIITFGIVPNEKEIRAQVEWLRTQVGEQIFATDALSKIFPPALRCADRASGLLAVRVQRFNEIGSQGERIFLWWRPEQPQKVYWAGDPRKGAVFDEHNQRLSPRSSFEQWIEITTGHSEQWSEADLLRAKKFRSMILRNINADLLTAP